MIFYILKYYDIFIVPFHSGIKYHIIYNNIILQHYKQQDINHHKSPARMLLDHNPKPCECPDSSAPNSSISLSSPRASSDGRAPKSNAIRWRSS